MSTAHDRKDARPAGWLPLGWVRYLRRKGREYMNRYSLRAQGESGQNPWRVYVNHFLGPDDPGCHNHPWVWSLSIVLWGSYTEEVLEPTWHYRDGDRGALPSHMPTLVRTRRVRWFNWIPAYKYHRVVTLHPSRLGGRGVVTLFICGPLTGRGWGWWIPGRGHVPFVAPTGDK